MMMASVSPDESRSVKIRRTSTRPSRFEPDQPLHMTTRRAARKNGSTPSINGSFDDNLSRRSSLDDTRTSSPNGSVSAAAGYRRPSPAYVATSVPALSVAETSVPNLSTSVATLEGATQSEDVYRPSPSPALKRKRSSSPTSVHIPVANTVSEPPPNENHSTNNHDTMDTADNAASTIDLAPKGEPGLDINEELVDPATAADSPDQIGSDGQSSQKSEQQIAQQLTVPDPSTDATPMISAAASPASSISPSDNDPKAANDGTESVIMAEADDVEAPSVADEADVANEDGPVQTEDETRPQRRMGGRKRAAHPNMVVEAALRRQAELRSTYRQIARQQKLILLEIATRTLENLNSDPDAHTKAREHEGVMASLEERLMQTKARIQLEHDLKVRLMDQRLNDERQVRTAQCRQAINEYQDQHLAYLEHQVLQIERKSTMASQEDVDTEDEDDVVVRPKQMRYRKIRGPTLGYEYDSRSRHILETEWMTGKLESRFKMSKLLRNHGHDDSNTASFTVMESRTREAALARRHARESLAILAQAGTEVSSAAMIPIIPNSQAMGLQMLSDLAGRPPLMPPPSVPVAPVNNLSFIMHPSGAPVRAPRLDPTRDGYTTPADHSSPKNPLFTGEQRDGSARHATIPRYDIARQLASPKGKIELLPPGPSTPAAQIQSNDQRRSNDTGPYQALRLPGFGRQLEFRLDDATESRHAASLPKPPRYGSEPIITAEKALAGQDRPKYEFQPASPMKANGPSNMPKPQASSKSGTGMRDILNRPAGFSGVPNDPFHVPIQQSPANLPAKPAVEATKSTWAIATPTDPTRAASGGSRRGSNTKKPALHKRTNKEERQGASRRQSKFSIKRPHGHSLSSGNVEHIMPAPKLGPSALSPIEQAPRRPSWDSTRPLAPPPPSAYAPPPFFAGPQPGPHSSSLAPLGPGDHRQRGSVPNLPPLPPGWSRPPPPPPGQVYTFAHPPPPGTVPEHWRVHPYGLPPPYVPYGPPQPPPPGTSLPPTQQFGGPALAPASQDPRYQHGGSGAAPLPAFAQQQKQGDGQRRRTQSDSQPKIHQWTPEGRMGRR